MGASVLLSYAGLPREMSVQIKEGQLRESPAFLAKIVARLPYGEPVEIVAERGAWAEVSIPQRQLRGWLHVSALSSEKIRLQAGAASQQAGASRAEVALAGKGFDKNVEEEFRRLHPNLDFQWVDRMETFRVSTAEMQGFLAQGAVQPAGGGVE
ncbi:MAG: hypothetical protein A2521_14860 [Deltaproteobacteria bacterium RIFOXYD12_FULL_57_12]|nr:MAG: hypothetical protein A2521_14860 [Deltaproteobacteria bacterium RIFOXYD12_FULL_57_12]